MKILDLRCRNVMNVGWVWAICVMVPQELSVGLKNKGETPYTEGPAGRNWDEILMLKGLAGGAGGAHFSLVFVDNWLCMDYVNVANDMRKVLELCTSRKSVIKLAMLLPSTFEMLR